VKSQLCPKIQNLARQKLSSIHTVQDFVHSLFHFLKTACSLYSKTQSLDFCPNYVQEFSLYQGKISYVHTAQDCVHSPSTSQDSLFPIRHSLWTFVPITSKNSASIKAKFPLYILHRIVYTLPQLLKTACSL
jgi:hypothetical protein